MSVPAKFSETKSKGFYLAEGSLTEDSILAMAKASQERTRVDKDRLKKRIASTPEY